jgi:hypothetical protein
LRHPLAAAPEAVLRVVASKSTRKPSAPRFGRPHSRVRTAASASALRRPRCRTAFAESSTTPKEPLPTRLRTIRPIPRGGVSAARERLSTSARSRARIADP